MDVIAWDQELFIYLNNLGTPTWDSFWLLITDKKTWIPLYIILAYFIYRTFGWKKTLIILAGAGLMILCADQISHFYKDILIQRFRPCRDPEIAPFTRLVKNSCGGDYGFFSGHATNHMAMAVYVGLIFRQQKWLLPILVLWAMMVAYSRIYIGVHYPLDILTGLLMGSLLAIFFYQVQRIYTNKC
ncbi:phosphatase PAP2 family protein [Flavobacteriaceae bacterium Ap0902]|nr:phosphatase PAP2 family protein [Flavobacteriaceae bacterium Ap0902]